MCQPLPYADFQWVEDVSNFDVSSIALDSPTGYILEVDLEYPQHLHNAHTNLPFCPTRDKPPGKRENKLLATLYDKKRYVILPQPAAMYASRSSRCKNTSYIKIHAIFLAS